MYGMSKYTEVTPVTNMGKIIEWESETFKMLNHELYKKLKSTRYGHPFIII
jgi:hypothetical protein